MYTSLEQELKKSEINKNKLLEIWLKLTDGLNIQESSASMMTCMIQDLLDYAGIKSGNFRKTIKKFNIRETI
jgi:hypothetical protein